VIYKSFLSIKITQSYFLELKKKATLLNARLSFSAKTFFRFDLQSTK